MKDSVYTIQAMDCPTEEGLIRGRLRSVDGITRIQVDLLNRRLTVTHTLTNDNTIVAALVSIGMTPARSPIQGDAAADACGDGAACSSVPALKGSSIATASAQPWWRKYGPLTLAGVMAVASEGLYFAGVKEAEWPVIALALASIALGGLPTLRKGYYAVKTFTLNINFLMTVAVIGACVIGAWPEAAMVTFLFAVAELIERGPGSRSRFGAWADGDGPR